jgi:hypothetical protein
MSHTCEELVAAARYLEANGMSNEQLRSIHHSKRRKESFASTYRYFGVNKELKFNNMLYAQRLKYVANGHRQGNQSIAVLVRKAIEQWPLRT